MGCLELEYDPDVVSVSFAQGVGGFGCLPGAIQIAVAGSASVGAHQGEITVSHTTSSVRINGRQTLTIPYEINVPEPELGLSVLRPAAISSLDEAAIRFGKTQAGCLLILVRVEAPAHAEGVSMSVRGEADPELLSGLVLKKGERPYAFGTPIPVSNGQELGLYVAPDAVGDYAGGVAFYASDQLHARQVAAFNLSFSAREAWAAAIHRVSLIASVILWGLCLLLVGCWLVLALHWSDSVAPIRALANAPLGRIFVAVVAALPILAAILTVVCAST